MKFVTFRNKQGAVRAGWQQLNGVIDMNEASGGELPSDMLSFLANHEHYMDIIRSKRLTEVEPTYPMESVRLLAPLPNPRSVRDFVSFETHVQNATKRNGNTVAKEWYEVPIFYFSNHHAITGPEQEIPRPKKCNKLDYELEIACVIGKQGRDIKAGEAEEHIFGYTIFNDWSARDLQAQEMKVLLGPAKGKDFATSIGPYLVTKDEIEAYRNGDRFDMEMTATVNGQLLSKGNFKDIHYTFGQMIERASEEVTLYPGDIIGSGTVGFGCLLELGPEIHRWLEPGDVVELGITGLGRLRNRVV